MPHRMPILALTLALLCPAEAAAQTYAIESDLLFYGDNTEFANPFRSGETIMGVAGRVWLDVTLNDSVSIQGGFFGGSRFGAHEAFEHAEPAIALQLSRGGSRFRFGSIDTIAWHHDVPGPDVETPHGLLPPLQVETLTFTRGQEMGLQWLLQSATLEHDAWINWQRLNTAEARERFDAGYRSSIRLTPAVRLHGQWHAVHEGGQQFRTGPVSDSQAGALGVSWSRKGVTVEAHAVGTRDVPDRERPHPAEAGAGVFLRGALQRGAWRTHVITWRGWDPLKAEGDANYLSRRRDGAFFAKVRDYAELGLTRHFRPAPGVHVYAAVRLHRVESHYEYSYRIVGRVHLRRAL